MKKYPVGTTEKTRETQNQMQINGWTPLTSKLSSTNYSLNHLICCLGRLLNPIYTLEKNRKDEAFSCQNAIMLYPLDIMFASTTTLNIGLRENNLCVIMSVHEKHRKVTFIMNLTIQYILQLHKYGLVLFSRWHKKTQN